MKIIKQEIQAPIQPYWKRVFLPILVSKYDVKAEAITCYRFINIGKVNFIDGAD
jgi:hypothetical protein